MKCKIGCNWRTLYIPCSQVLSTLRRGMVFKNSHCPLSALPGLKYRRLQYQKIALLKIAVSSGDSRGIPDWSGSNRCGLQNCKPCSRAICGELCLHADRQRDVSAGDMSRLQPVDDRPLDVLQNPHDNLLQGVVLPGRLAAVRHLSKDDSSYPLQLACKPHLHEHAIDLVRLGSDVFKE